MICIKHGFLISFLSIAFYSCWSQTIDNNQNNTVKFEKLIFHSSRCNGACPQVDFEIDSNRIIVLNREFFKTKSETNKSKSGQFKGVLNQQKFSEFFQVLKSSDYKNLKFPDIVCCDGVVTTIIIYADKKRKYLKSMTPPQSALKLISYLFKLGTEIKLARINIEINIEE